MIEMRAQRLGKLREPEEDEIPFIGKTYTFMFGRTLCFDSASTQAIIDDFTYSYRELRHPKSPQEFTIQKIISDNYSQRFFQVKTQVGNIGYINTSNRLVNSKKLTIADPNNENELLYTGCIFSVPPEQISILIQKVVEDKKAKSADLERRIEEHKQERIKISLRPSARIGMTSKQVIDKTYWGPPESINTTTSGKIVSEQWVYPNYQYLYFENGKLVTIQTSR